jgi:uncharacterized SAM-binding protein YcdF (DUF218 family)
VFLFKKIVGPLLFPVPLCLIILLLGLIFHWFTRRQRTGKIIVSLGVGLLLLLSYSAFSDMLLRPLEYRYTPVKNFEELQDVKWVVVLAGGHVSDKLVPITSQLEESSVVRVVESIRLQKMLPNSKLLLSGGGVFDPVPSAKLMADLALALGVESQDIVLETGSRDTKDEARLIGEMVGDDRFALVTSASHMPRSMAMFRKLGMNPIPAPTDHWVKERQALSPSIFYPSANGLRKAERAFYEYLGLMWAKLRGQV